LFLQKKIFHFNTIAVFIIAMVFFASFSSNRASYRMDGWESRTLLAPSFVKLDLNELTTYNNDERMVPFFEKMEKLVFNGEGRISILHMGGSHVQGGFLTDRLRYNFSTLTYGVKGERGFVFPYKIAGTNSPYSIKCNWRGNWSGCRSSVSTHECDWGMSGISAITSDEQASFEIMVSDIDSTFFESNVITIYHNGNEEYEITPDSAMMLVEIARNMEDGYDVFTFAKAYDSFRFNIKRCVDQSSPFILQGIYFGNSDAEGFTYNAIGVNGAGTYSYLRSSKFASQMNTLKPDLIFFGIGVNDANVPEGDFNQNGFEERYERLIQMIRSSNKDAVFVFITNNDTYYQKRSPNKNAYKVQESMHRLAEKYDGAVYDLFTIMGGLGSIDDWKDAQLAASDRIHLTKKGYELQADMMFEAFRKAFGDYLNEKYSN
jgi:lysophospholipase L1-like esterase